MTTLSTYAQTIARYTHCALTQADPYAYAAWTARELRRCATLSTGKGQDRAYQAHAARLWGRVANSLRRP